MNEAQFLELDAASDRPNEFWCGRAFYRGGESPVHCRIAARLMTALNTRLDNTNFEVAGSLLRVRLDEPRHYAYPDIVVWAQDAGWSDDEHDTLLTPLLLAEIIAPHSWQRDLMLKVEHYLRVPSVCDYLILWPDCVKIHHYARRGDEWHFTVLTRRDEVIPLVGLGLEVPVAEVYARLNVPEGDGPSQLLFDAYENLD